MGIIPGLGRDEIFLVLLSYGYVLALIVVSGRLEGVLGSPGAPPRSSSTR